MSKMDLKSLKNKRACLKSSITRINKFLESPESDLELFDLNNRLEKLKPALEQFEDIQFQIQNGRR